LVSSSKFGTGGNISLNLQALLLMRNNGLINAESMGASNGGNITIDSPIIVGLENSDIIANAKGGRGGNINITTQDLISLKFRNTLTPRTDLTNDITASSEFSINGNVSVNTIGINPTNALNELPSEVIDSSRQIADRCGAAKTSSFVATGRGGMPQNPMKKKGSDRPWNDARPPSATASIATQPIVHSQPLVEASTFSFDESGVISLIAPKSVEMRSAATCAMVEEAIGAL
jgi:large exoprotein involved in heme utilization and adhesion